MNNLTQNAESLDNIPASAKQKLAVWKKLLLALLIIIVVGTAFILIANSIVKASGERIISTEIAQDEDSDCILILGAGLNADGKPSSMLKDRLDQGISLYQAGAADKLLMSGDHGQTNYDEVNAMKAYAIDAGVPSEDVFMDHAGFSTYESIYRARDVFLAEKILIVTQEYHLYRALYIAGALDMEAYGVAAADPNNYYGQGYRELREIAARCKDFLYCLFQPQPTFLGEAIPVTGDGNSTND